MKRSYFILALLSIAMVYHATAFAFLGETRTSVAPNAKLLKSKNFQIQVVQSDAQTLKEYVDADGFVFAVAWSGAVVPPDLTQWLGDYASEYGEKAAGVSRAQGRQPVIVKTSEITVYRGGRMKSFHGLAVVNDRMPDGVKLEDLQ